MLANAEKFLQALPTDYRHLGGNNPNENFQLSRFDPLLMESEVAARIRHNQIKL